MPDHPSVLQTYIWQAYDVAPRFPALTKFLEFWQRELDGRLPQPKSLAVIAEIQNGGVHGVDHQPPWSRRPDRAVANRCACGFR